MDGIDRLECVYYPSPVQADTAVLTVLCLLFDKIYFPNAYLPKGDYDKEALEREIARLDGLGGNRRWETERLIGVLRFLKYRAALDGILEYPTSRDDIFVHGRDEEGGALARFVYDANYAPREGFTPAFDSASVKGLPNSDEAVAMAGEFYYQGKAIKFAAERGLPLLDDGSGLALPFRGRFKNNAKGLSALVAVESIGLVLPELPILATQDLVDFRIENEKELRAFRASMLRYARTLNEQLTEEMPVEEVAQKVKFLVETEIAPALHDLRRDLLNPNRPWHRRVTDATKIVSSVVAGVLTGGAAAAEALRDVAVAEFEAKGEKAAGAQRNGLYYLLKAQDWAK